jgi:dUTP pyrophosphatase
MKKLKVRIKKLVKEAVIPFYSKDGDAGMDLTATSKIYDEYGNVVYGTGLAFEIPEGYVGLLFPRSSNSKKDLLLSNSVGVLDSGHRGEVIFKFKPSVVLYNNDYGQEGTIGIPSNSFDDIVVPTIYNELEFQDYKVGNRIGQIIILPYPKIEFIESEELSETERGIGGFGSSGD